MVILKYFIHRHRKQCHRKVLLNRSAHKKISHKLLLLLEMKSLLCAIYVMSTPMLFSTENWYHSSLCGDLYDCIIGGDYAVSILGM